MLSSLAKIFIGGANFFDAFVKWESLLLKSIFFKKIRRGGNSPLRLPLSHAPANAFSLMKCHIVDVFDYLLNVYPNANMHLFDGFNRYDFSFLSHHFHLVINIPTFGNSIFCDENVCDIFSTFSQYFLIYLHHVIFLQENA